LPSREAWAITRGAWVGLLLLEPTPAFREAMPSKLYEYLACGLPVVATPLPRVADLLATTGAGVVVDDASGVTAILRRWLLQPEELGTLRAAALEAASAFPDETGHFVRACRELSGHRRERS
jgi:glycosyltransferase involved in cell wall biosynthesis